MVNFSFFTCPAIYFGAGQSKQLPSLAAQFGSKVLLVTGANALEKSGYLVSLQSSFEQMEMSCNTIKIGKEPSPEFIDENCDLFRSSPPDVVIGIGGGSVLDAAKAISAMMKKNDSVIHYLEGIGTKKYDGCKVPLIAVPTTAGTGSESTKNAVLGREGRDGFKSSLRHDSLIPNIAVIDPVLMLSCPSHITAACGLDAFTQLLESYLSTKSNSMTDALAISGIEHCKNNLVAAASYGSQDVDVRSAMAYAALLSGMTLANAGLGVVHGFASSIGGRYAIPHGLVCGILLPVATQINIAALKRSRNSLFLEKYARVAQILSSCNTAKAEDLVEILKEWNRILKIPGLQQTTHDTIDIEQIAVSTGQKNNPVSLTKQELKEILVSSL